MSRFGICIMFASLVSACAVTDVDPVLPSSEITSVCIDSNPDVSDNYSDEIGDLLEQMGIKSRMTGGAFPGECPHRLRTDIKWSNTLIKYVVSLKLVIYESSRPLGDATYFVGNAARTPERLGSAASKAKPLLKQLLAEYDSTKSD